MNDFQKPIHRNDQRPIEQPQAVPPIEKDKKGGGEEQYPSGDWEGEEARTFLITTLFSTIKKLLYKIGDSSSNALPHPVQLKQDLQKLRDLFTVLTYDDQSHNSDYLFNLSELWHGLLTDFSSVDVSEKKSMPIVKKINDITSAILHYPPKEDHSLGYYLTEHAGREWIPFPLMNLLQDLYKQHQKKPEDSSLSVWIARLNDIIIDLDILVKTS